MIGTLFTSPTFVAFVVASLVLAITPGPGVVYIVMQTLGQGRKAGLASIGGIALGNLGNASAASVGLAAVFAASPVRLFRDGFLVALLNPKTALFFAALLPQFISPKASPLVQSLVFGCVFVSIALCTDTIYVLTAAVVAAKLRQRVGSRPYGRYLSAATFIGLGVYAALASPRGTVVKY